MRAQRKKDETIFSFPPLSFLTGVLKIPTHSRVLGLWLFLLILIIILGQETTLIEAKVGSRKDFGKDKTGPGEVPKQYTGSFTSTLFAQAPETTLPPQSINPAAMDFFSSTMTTCFPVTPEVIARFCTGATSPENVIKVVTAVTEVMAISPIIAEYINIVFNFLPGFKIFLLTRTEMTEAAREVGVDEAAVSAAGGYFIKKHTLYLSYNLKQKDYDRSLIIHEFRHAVMHTMQIAKAHSMTDLNENYFPLIKEEGAKAMRLMEKGNDHIRRLYDLLKLEKNRELTKKNKKYLARLRKIAGNDPHARHYFQDVDLTVSSAVFKSLFKGKIDQVVNLPEYPYGPLKLRSYQQVAPDEFAIDCIVGDPLWALVRAHEKALARVAKYHPEQHIREMDAHVFQRVPVPFLKKFFPEYLKYTRHLVAATDFPGRIHTDSMSPYEFMYMHDLEAERLLTRSESLFELSDAKEMMTIINRYVDHHTKLDSCERGAELLIKKGVKIGEAKLALGDIHYLRGDHTAAANSYGIALQKKIIFRADQLLHYAESLITDKNYKEAEAICSKALKSGPILGWTKKKFEEIAKMIKEKQIVPTVGLGSVSRA